MQLPDPKHEIHGCLDRICKRQQKRRLISSGGRGLLLGSTIAVILGFLNLALMMWRFLSAAPSGLSEWPAATAVLSGLAAAALLAGPLVAGWLALRRKPDRPETAAAVDRHYQLQDRTATAIRFLEKADRTELEEMQIADCRGHLARVDPRAVIPIGLPKSAPAAAFLSVLALAAMVGPLFMPPSSSLSSRPAPRMTTPVEPDHKKPARHVAATSPDSRADVNWGAAPSGEVVVGRTDFLVGPTLEEVVSGTHEPPPAKPADQPRPGDDARRGHRAETVLEGEPLPLEHRRTVRLYFESIRPKHYEPLDQPPPVP